MRAVLLLLTVLVTPPGMATPITFTFVGEVFGSPTGIFAGESLVSGMYTFDSALVARSAVPTTEINVFTAAGPFGPNEFIYNWFISVTIGSVTRTSADNALLTGQSQNHVLEFNDSPIRDAFAYDLLRTTDDDGRRIRILLQDEAVDDSDGIPELIGSGSGGLTGSPIVRALDASLADCSPNPPNLQCLSFVRTFVQIDGTNVRTGRADFIVTSIARVTPEPTTTALLALGLLGTGRFNRRRL